MLKKDKGAIMQFLNQSNISPTEYYRLYGALDDERIEFLLNNHSYADGLDGAEIDIEEAQSQYLDEDFLKNEIDQLYDLAKRLRGYNRETLLSIIIKIEEEADEEVRAGEYGSEKLKEVLKLIGR